MSSLIKLTSLHMGKINTNIQAFSHKIKIKLLSPTTVSYIQTPKCSLLN